MTQTSAKKTEGTQTKVSKPRQLQKKKAVKGLGGGTKYRVKNKKVFSKAPAKKAYSMPIATEKKELPPLSYTPYVYSQAEVCVTPIVDKPAEIDENTPKSRPKYEKDHYIRKRMIIAGSSYCDEAVLAKLRIGTYFDLVREPDNSYDKNAVALMYEGEKIGYVAKKDVVPFAVCLNLRRVIYGVITDIVMENGFTKYEYETWFDEGARRKTESQ